MSLSSIPRASTQTLGITSAEGQGRVGIGAFRNDYAMIAFITERIMNRPTIGGSLPKMGSRWIMMYTSESK